MKNNKNVFLKRVLCLFICITLFFQSPYPFAIQAKAASKKRLTISQVQRLAIALDKNYQRTYNKIEIKKVKYVAAIKSIAMKKKNMRTFRWTPLLSFKFPEQPALVDEYEWQYKPIQIQSEITLLNHKLTDCIYAAEEAVSVLYIEVYVCQQKIENIESRLERSNETLKRNEARLSMGQANQSDIDKLKQSIEKLSTELSLQMRTFESKKRKLSAKIKMDVSTGYIFENPMIESNLSRSMLTEMINCTLENDQSYYEIKMNESLSLTSLNMTESFMKNQYGSKMSTIQPYVNQAKAGGDINEIAFKKDYDKFLKAIDRPWDGKIKILFIKITMEWFKGSVAGSRYVEDDPYALYTSSLDYKDAREEKESAKNELTELVRDSFENLITARNAYESAKKLNSGLERELARSMELNRMGKLTYEELREQQEEYEQGQIDEMDLLNGYSALLYSFNRLTCGAISKYIHSATATMNTASGGDSYVTADPVEGAYYYIETKIEDKIFIFGVQIPEDFTLSITHYELHINNVIIGEKTDIDKQLRHLALDIEQVESVEVYLYDDDKLLEICKIDSTINRGPLNINAGYKITDIGDGTNKKKVASFKYNIDDEKNIVSLSFEKELGEGIAYYTISVADGGTVYSDELKPISEDYTYLSVLVSDLSKLRITFYDIENKKLYVGTFDMLTGGIYVDTQ